MLRKLLASDCLWGKAHFVDFLKNHGLWDVEKKYYWIVPI